MERAIPDVKAILESGRLTSAFGMGPYLVKLEGELAKIEGYAYCVVYGGGTLRLLHRLMDLNGFQWIKKEIGKTRVIEETTMWAIFTDDEKSWTYLRRLRVHGYDFEEQYKHDFLGLGARPSEMQAAVGLRLIEDFR